MYIYIYFFYKDKEHIQDHVTTSEHVESLQASKNISLTNTTKTHHDSGDDVDDDN